MKILSNTLFSKETHGNAFVKQNTFFIDDSPNKSICNDNSSAIFLDMWTHAKRRDDILMGELLPWL